MKKYLILLLVIVLTASILFMGISCGNREAPAVEEEVIEDIDETEVKSGTDHEVIIENFVFDSSDLTIKVGDTVTWTNNDGAAHTVKIGTIESDNMSKSDTFSFTFSEVGTFEYICGLHPYMKGKIIVE